MTTRLNRFRVDVVAIVMLVLGTAMPVFGQAEEKPAEPGQAVYLGKTIVRAYHREPTLVTEINSG